MLINPAVRARVLGTSGNVQLRELRAPRPVAVRSMERAEADALAKVRASYAALADLLCQISTHKSASRLQVRAATSAAAAGSTAPGRADAAEEAKSSATIADSGSPGDVVAPLPSGARPRRTLKSH